METTPEVTSDPATPDRPIVVDGVARVPITVPSKLNPGDRVRHPTGFVRTLVRRKRPDEMGYPGWQLDDSGGVADSVLVDVEWTVLVREARRA